MRSVDGGVCGPREADLSYRWHVSGKLLSTNEKLVIPLSTVDRARLDLTGMKGG